ncbi:conserved hypothetical protein [delta proteobacterium NaphS2]|nr:conserved hypothetical protein [delta proteobacterium NaphS2]
MDIREQIYSETQLLPDSLAKEVLHFIEYIVMRHRLTLQGKNGLKEAQETVMNDIWDNPEDEVWNDA